METNELRIYVIIAETVQVPRPIGPGTFEDKTVYQPNGRAMAQGEHVVSLMRMKRLVHFIQPLPSGRKGLAPEVAMEPITTINLAARNSLELEHIKTVLKLARVDHEAFYDDNVDAYGLDVTGQPVKVLTAVCTWPTHKNTVKDLLGYLPLWKNGVCG